MSDPTGAQAGSLYVPGFKANLNLSPQQSTSRLLNTVDNDLNYSETGQFFNADDVGTSDPADVTTRVPDSPDGFVDLARRFGAFKGYNDGKFIDNADLARELEDPTNKVMAAMMAGQGRKRDVAIINGALGSYQYQDQNQNYQTGAANTNIIVANFALAHEGETISAVYNATSTGYGLTIGKLIQAKMMLDNSEIDEPMPGDASADYYFACTATQIGQLLQSVPASNKFYNEVQALAEGTISRFMGFNFKRLPANAKANPLPKASYTRSCIAYHKRAILYRARPIIQTEIAKRGDKAFRWYAYYEAEHGAVRRYDTGVWQVNCDEATTSYT
jgi:hypothetical protein